jgi:hypothetical protein
MFDKYTEEDLKKEYNQNQLSIKLDVNRAYISKLVKDKKLTLNVNKKISLEDALKQIQSHQNPSYSKKINVKTEKQKQILEEKDEKNLLDIELDNLDFNEARTLKERYLAGQAKVDYLIKIKSVYPVEEIEREAFGIGRELRDNLLNIGEKISDILAVESNAGKIRDILRKEIKITLDNIETKLNAKFNEEE